MDISAENIEQMIPPYLRQGAKVKVTNALHDFPNSTQYYTDFQKNSILQGDGWSSFDVLNFIDGRRDEIKGIVLSNSCDVSTENPRDLPPKITVAPIIKLNNYIKLLENNEIEKDRIRSRIESIKAQEITNIFYLPKGGLLNEDHIALLDDLHTIPLGHFVSKQQKLKQFTLSQTGFYLFLIKLSIHFCRFHENIDRDTN